MRLAALAAAALLAPTVATAPDRPPRIVTVTVGHDRATGFVAGDGRVVTVAHLVGADDVAAGDDVVGGEDVTAGDDVAAGNDVVGGDVVVAVDGDELRVDGRPARVVRLDRRNDLAVLRVAGLEGEARIGGGEGTSLLGRPAPVVRRITARVDGGPPRNALEVRADVSIGDSGAPLVTRTGRVAGVVFARSRIHKRTAYAVDATAIAALLK